MATLPFDSVFVLCGLPPRTSDLAPLGLPPGMLPLDADGRSNLDRLLATVRPIMWGAAGEEPDGVSEAGRFRVLVESSFDPAKAGRPELDRYFVADRDRYRGTGGVLSDAADDLDDNARILVLVASEVVGEELAEAIETVAAVDADVVLCRRADFTPSGLWSVRAGCLRRVSKVGYADFKEQVLADLSDSCDIRAATLPKSGRRLHAIRDLNSYLACLADARAADGSGVIAEPGVERSPEALVVDSVLLRGAVVEAGAVVARSVVGPGVRVRSGQRVVDEVRSASESDGGDRKAGSGTSGSNRGEHRR